MLKLIAGDTETTGLSPKAGDKIIEIGLCEVTRDANPRTYHQFLNPEGREISDSAYAVHGISAEQLADMPTFAEAYPALIEFIGDSNLIIHNAPFDLGFFREESLNAGLEWPEPGVIDTLVLAAKEFPNSHHNLDALCRRFNIDLAKRDKHGALIDAELLADLYMAWKGQSGLDLQNVEVKRAIVDMEKLGSLNTVKVALPQAAPEAAPSQSWAKHFEGIKL